MQKKSFLSKKITIKGLVQGVGFRPFVYKLAKKLSLSGWVRNTNESVEIIACGKKKALSDFIKNIKQNPPGLAEIYSIDAQETDFLECHDFKIKPSVVTSGSITNISPDIAVCELCIDDLKHQEHRIDYPFINCTNCGPRFTIIKGLPYDRIQSTMSAFELCDICHSEYKDIEDRRFHAQPIACKTCGPHYTLLTKGREITSFKTIISHISEIIDSGAIVCMKGLGGYNLTCDALNEKAVLRLREIKKREGKPFAMMVRDLSTVKKFFHVNDYELEALHSPRRPILLIKPETTGYFPAAINKGLYNQGVLLPYLPLHYLLFEGLQTDAIVFTSANLADEPIVKDDNEATKKFLHLTDGVLINNREIYNRCDDSVSKVINGRERIIRRSRGYVPAPINLDLNVEGILATGAELKNTFCIGKGKQAILSQHIGDLKNAETFAFYQEMIERYKKLFRFTAQLIVCDKHPDYLSAIYAKNSGLPVLQVQHHHAHIVSCMAEHGIQDKVIGVCFDGTGYGDDGHIWGSEFFTCDVKGYKRYTHFEYLSLPGGDTAVKNPWKIAAAIIHSIYKDKAREILNKLFKKIPKQEIEIVLASLNSNLQFPLSCGASRYFDAAAALLGICTHISFEAEGPMKLEAVIDRSVSETYPYEINEAISLNPLFEEMIQDIGNAVSNPVISAKFHNTIIDTILSVSNKIRSEKGLHTVVLSGGTFQNSYLLTRTEEELTGLGFAVYSHERIPTNDGGISTGQLLIGARNVN